MRGEAVVVGALALFVSACGQAASSERPAAATQPVSSWRLASLEVDGEPLVIEKPLFLDITEDGFFATTTCNSIGGQLGGDMMTTAMLCPDDRMVAERYISQALQAAPTEQGDQLIFDDGHVRLVYGAFVDPLLTDLFAVLGDPDASVDEAMLPSEQATGTVPPDFDARVPVPSPSSDVDLFLADFEGDPCLVYGTTSAVNLFCNPVRTAAELSSVVDIPMYEQPIMRVALIPDRFASAAAARPDLGTYESNVLFVRGDVPPGNQTLTDDDGNTFVLVVPPPWTDPLAASRTDPPFATTVPATEMPSAEGTTSTVEPAVTTEVTVEAQIGDCAPAPHIELRSDVDTVPVDLVYDNEHSPTCGHNADGAAMFDPAYRPERALLAGDGRLEVVVDEPAEITVDVRVLEPGINLGSLAAAGEPLPISDGAYPVTLPGAGCFVVTIGFETDTRRGQYVALASAAADGCHPG